MTMKTNELTLLSLTQVAARLGVSERTIQRMVTRGAIPVIRVGQTPVFDWDAVATAAMHQAPKSPLV